MITLGRFGAEKLIVLFDDGKTSTYDLKFFDYVDIDGIQELVDKESTRGNIIDIKLILKQ